MILAILFALASAEPTIITSSTSTVVDRVDFDHRAGGGHFRLTIGGRAIHLFRPRGYDPSRAGTVVYVHGYFTHVDQAFEEHHLAEQFVRSAQNAQFIAPEAPAGKTEPVFFPDLGALLRETSQRTRTRLPDGPVIVLAHSGAYRTVFSWLDYRRLDEIILLDALYGHEEEFGAWLKDPANKLVVVSIETRARALKMLEDFPLAARREALPLGAARFSPNERGVQLLYVESQLDHMALVSSEDAIPRLLRLTPLSRLP